MSLAGLTLSKLSREERELLELLLKKEGLDLTQIPIPRRNPSVPVPLSYTQQRLWSAGLFAPHLPYGNVAMGFHIQGPVRLDVLKRSLNEIVRRHEILRTSFSAQDGQILQIVHPFSPLAFIEPRLGGQSLNERLDEAISRAHTEVERMYDLTKERMLKVALFTLGKDELLLVLVLHHLAADGWGMRVLLRELSQLYAAFLEGRESPLPEPVIQYGDFAVWQREWYSEQLFEQELQFWKRQLCQLPQNATLPFAHRKVVKPSFRSRTVDVSFTPELTLGLQHLSRRCGVTMFTTLMAAYQALIYSYWLKDDVVVGTTVSNRDRSEVAELIGNFGNNLFIRVNVADDPTALELLERVNGIVLDAHAHQHLPLELLDEYLKRDTKSTPLPAYQTMFVVRDSSTESNLVIPDVSITSVHLDPGVAAMDLKIDLTDDETSLHGLFEYKADVLEESIVRWIVEKYQLVLERFASTPHCHLSGIASLVRSNDFEPFVRAEEVRKGVVEASDAPQYTPPRDTTEQELVAIWERIVGVKPIGVTDNFFEIGGRSLMAVSLFTEIERRFGKNLPLATLFEAPTIDGLARVIRDEYGTTDWSCLVRMKPRGSKTPFFLIHAIGGNLLNYNDLLNHIDPERPVYGLQSHGLDGKSPPHASVEEMAEHYVSEIKKIQPRGPYLLGGLSFGGVVVYEIARQLDLAGDKVGMLVLFDAYHYAYQRSWSKTKYLRFKLRGYYERVKFHSRNLIFGPDRLRYLREKSILAMEKLRAAWRLLRWRAISGYHQHTGRDLPPAINMVREANRLAFRKYVPQPYSGRLTLFRATQLSVAHAYDTQQAWESLVLGGLEIHDVPGAHEGSLVEPNVRAVAEVLNSRLEKAESTTAGSDDGIAHSNFSSKLSERW